MAEMRTEEMDVPGIGAAALLRTPDDGHVRGGVVLLHPAYSGHRDQPLFAHAASTLTALGYAVLSYDRRSPSGGGDVPFADQAEDACLAVEAVLERYQVPTGIWAYSQGAWAAPLAAAGNDQVAHLALLGCAGVSPAEQMRFHCAELMRRAGFGPEEQSEMLKVRDAVDNLERMDDAPDIATRDNVNAMLADARHKRWFQHAYLPSELPHELHEWVDMDFDPAPIVAQVRCPVVLIYGAKEECVPVSVSEQVWRNAVTAAQNPDLEVVKLPGVGHWPGPLGLGELPPEPGESAEIDPGYTNALVDWYTRRMVY